MEVGQGTLSATLGNDTSTADFKSGGMAEQGKTVTFTAKPDAQFAVDAWSISGGTFKTGGTA